MLIQRLENARIEIEKSFNDKDYATLAKDLKRFKGLYEKCKSLGEDTLEYHYAEYLHLLSMSAYYAILDSDGMGMAIFQSAQSEKWKAGLKVSDFTGKYIHEQYPDLYKEVDNVS